MIHTCKCSTCRTRGVILPGWVCSCGAFNGEAKDERNECRACGKAPKLNAETRRKRNERLSVLFVNEGLTITELAVRFGLSRPQASRIARGVIDSRVNHQKKEK